MNITSKRGSLDNVVTYEHYCDEKKDLSNIPQDQITLGSIAIVLKDDGDAMCVYIANSNKEWVPIGIGGGGSDMGDVSLANLLDISLANPTDGQTLVYNGETKKWENKSIENDNQQKIMLVKIYSQWNNDGVTYYSNKTAKEIYDFLNNGGYVVAYIDDGEAAYSHYVSLNLEKITITYDEEELEPEMIPTAIFGYFRMESNNYSITHYTYRITNDSNIAEKSSQNL